jgi:hypothetical protein
VIDLAIIENLPSIKLIRPVMTYARPAWEFAADTHLIKLQRLQNKVLRFVGKFGLGEARNRKYKKLKF